MRDILDLDLEGKRVFIRVDFNVPMEKGRITDDTRMRYSLQTINYALDHGATVILASHLGRPNGRKKAEFSLKPVAEHLKKLLKRRVAFSPDCIGTKAAHTIQKNPRGVILLENLRFHPEEETNDRTFSKELAALCDVYINDAFGTAHRAHASTVGMVQFVKVRAPGFLMANELKHLGKVLRSPDRPFYAILGGAKVSDKLEVIKNLIGKVDGLFIGGAMAYTFLKERRIPVGRSLVENQLQATCAKLEARARKRGIPFELPVDHVVAPSIGEDVESEVLAIDDAAIGDRMGVDIGPKTVAKFSQMLAANGAKTVVWNGPMGVFEIPAFAKGTLGIAKAVAAIDGETIVGGGDSVAAVTQAKLDHQMTHISTGGGASLEFLGGQVLPGVAALNQR